MGLTSLDVDRIQALFALFDIVRYLVILPKLFAGSGYMHKYIFTPIIGFDKAEAFTLIKKFYGTCWHWNKIKVWFKDDRNGQFTKTRSSGRATFC